MDTLLQRTKRFVSWHRRIIAALLVGVAAAVVFTQLRPSDADLTDVAVLATAREQGDRLTTADVHIIRVPRRHLPTEYLDTPEEAIGRTIGVGLSPGTVLQHGLLNPTPTVGEGRSLTPIQLSDPSLAEILSPGMSVTLVLSETSEIVASHSPLAPWVALAFDGSVSAAAEAARVLEAVDLVHTPQLGTPKGLD